MQEKSCSVYGVYQNKNSILKICEIFFKEKIVKFLKLILKFLKDIDGSPSLKSYIFVK